MDRMYDLFPFSDPQQARVYARCGVCGRELYGRLDRCGYCDRFFP